MSRIRREEQTKLLDTHRERVTKALDGLTLHGDASAMLAQIAYAVHPHVGAWDAESCDHLRNVLAELIGDAREAASGIESHSPCGDGGCDRGDEQTEVGDGMAGGGCGMREVGGDSACDRMGYSDVHQESVGYPSAQYDVLGNERHKAVCELRKLGKCSPLAHNFRDAIAAAVAVPKDDAPYDDGELCHLICDRLIHLLGGDQSHDTSPMRQENDTENPCTERYVLDTSKAKTIGCEPDVSESDDGTSVTKELREWVLRRETVENILMSMPPQTQRRLTYKGKRLLEMADDIDDHAEKLAHDAEMWRDRAEDMRMERDDAERERDAFKAKLHKLLKKTLGDAKLSVVSRYVDELEAENAKLRELMREMHGAYVDMTKLYENSEHYLLWSANNWPEAEIKAGIANLESRCEEDRHRFDEAMRELGI